MATLEDIGREIERISISLYRIIKFEEGEEIALTHPMAR